MFSSKFNNYLKEYKCSAKELSYKTNISPATISRYKNGKTVPSIDSGNIEAISVVFAELSGGRYREDEIYEDLLVAAYEDLEMVDFHVYSQKLTRLIDTLNITKSKLAEYMHLSSSGFSKICTGQVKPRNPVYIAEQVAHYVADCCTDEEQRRSVQYLVYRNSSRDGGFSSVTEYYRCVRKWLLNGENAKTAIVENLFYKYGEYDKNYFFDYRNEQINYPDIDLDTNKNMQTFFGLDGLQTAFWSWLENACNAKVNDEIIIFDEIVSKISREDYSVGYRYASAAEKLVKSGKKITIIHNLEDDMYIAAKKVLVWLPLNMSNRVFHYYINEPKKNLYRNTLLVSSNSAMIGNVINDDYENGYYTIINTPREVSIARARSEMILRQAEETYRFYNNKVEFVNETRERLHELDSDDPMFIYLAAPPLPTIGEDLLRDILQRNQIPREISESIVNEYYDKKSKLDKMLEKHPFHISLDYIDQDRWKKEPIKVALEYQNQNIVLAYTYEEYKQHFNHTEEYFKMKRNAECSIQSLRYCKNVNLLLVPHKLAIVSTLNELSVNTISTNPLIADTVIEILYIIAPKNAKEVSRDAERKEVLQYFKKLIS